MDDKVKSRTKLRGWAALIPLCCALALASACARGPDPQVSFDPAPVPAADPGLAPSGEPELAALPSPDPPRRGPFAFLRRDRMAAPAPPQTPPDAPPPPEYLVADLPPQPEPAAAPPPSTRPRPFGFLFKRVPGEVRATSRDPEPEFASAPVTDGPADPDPDAEIQVAMVPDPATAVDAEPRRGGWLFGGNRRAAKPVASPIISGPLPFGTVVEACGVPRRDMGTEVARSHGSGTYRLFDTEPSSLAPRTQYITGFRDGCARQFTASLALFGSAAVHEATRYNPQNSNPYSSTDAAYEKVKTRVCGVRRREFCPANRVDRLERNAAFVSVYRNFGGSGQWMEMFLHKGELSAHAVITQ